MHIRRSHFGKKPSNWLAVAALILCAQGALRLLYSKADKGSAKQAKFSREENLFFPRMIWSSPSGPMTPETTRVREELGEQQMNQLRDLCGRTLYHGILNVVVSYNFGRYAFFSTGWVPAVFFLPGENACCDLGMKHLIAETFLSCGFETVRFRLAV